MDISDFKIALISLQNDAERVPPIGLICLATYLRDRAGMKDENIKVFDNNYFSNIEEQVKDFAPHVVGITAMTVNYEDAAIFCASLKQQIDVPTIIGGVHISTLPNSLRDCFNIGVIGEGEETLGELAELYCNQSSFKKEDLKNVKSIIYVDNDRLVSTPRRQPLELDSLPIPDFKFAHSNYFREEEIPGISATGIRCYLLSSRGCPYRCEFCSTSRFWGKMRLHSPEYTARIVEKAINDFGANYIKVEDDLFTLNPKRLNRLKEAFEERGILSKIKGIECQPRANLITDDLCRAMKAIKVKVVNFGFESGSEKVLRYLKAGSVSMEMNKNAVIMCNKYGFNVYGSLMYGSPTETLEDMEKTNEFVDFCFKNGASYLWSFVATPFPSTPFWEIAMERGVVTNDMDFSLLQHHSLDNPLLLDPEISRDDFKKVFLKGRKKLKKFKLKLIRDFIFKNPFRTLSLVAKEPGYYFMRVWRQLFKQ